MYQHLKDWFIYTYGKICVICPRLFCSFTNPQHVVVLKFQLVYLCLYCRTFIRIQSTYLRLPDKEPRRKEPSSVTGAGRMILSPFWLLANNSESLNIVPNAKTKREKDASSSIECFQQLNGPLFWDVRVLEVTDLKSFLIFALSPVHKLACRFHEFWIT